MVKIEIILACLMLAALAGILIGLFSAIIKKIKRKSAKTSLKLAGISIVVFMAVTFIYPETQEKPSGTDKDQAEAVSGMDNISVPEETDNDTSEELENEDSDSKQEKGDREEEEYIGDGLSLEYASDFSEGRAWVQFNAIDRKNGSAEADREAVNVGLGSVFDRIVYALKNYKLMGKKLAALIDTQGKILWESQLTGKESVLKEKSEFRDGLAYCVVEVDDKCVYNIIDSDGNVTFTRDTEENYIILGHGGGLFLVAEHLSDFDSNEWKIGAIDKYGDIAVPFQVYENKPYAELESVDAPSGEAPDPNYDYDGYLEYQEQLEAYEEYMYNSSLSYKLSFDSYNNDEGCEYLGDGIFQLSSDGWNVLLNIEMQNIIYSYDTRNGGVLESFISEFENGAAMVVYNDTDGRSVCSLGTDGRFTKTAYNDWIRYSLSSRMEFGDGLVFASDSGDNNTITGSVILENLTTGAYYNTEGEKVIDFPEYDDKNLYYYGTPFQNGYAVMFIKGADEYLYITVINQKGKRMFEPKTGFKTACMSKDGKYLTAVKEGFLTVFDLKGKPLVSVECTNINPEYGFENNVHDGMVKVHSGMVNPQYYYVNIENGTVIGMFGDTKDSVKVH